MRISKEIWAFVPARSGSKSLKNKNIKLFMKKPLIAHSILVAKKIKKINRIIFSTDSKKYIKIASKYGCKNFHLRSTKVSSDTASEYSVFLDFIKKQAKEKKSLPKYFLHLRPTSPVRNYKTIAKAINFFLTNEKKYTALRSTSLMDNPAYRSYRIVNGKLCSIVGKDFKVGKYSQRRQLYPKTYKAGHLFEIYKTKTILSGDLWGNKVAAYVTKDLLNDIDTKDDIDNLEYYLKKNKIKLII
tara:strand:- start:8620 stop:9348 length:729 start_codon:yes stop_codon:yes gene_type:complete